VVGEVPRGLPQLSTPPLDTETIRALVPAAVAVALVGFVESISVAKAIAVREKYRIDPDQELVALGLANVSAAFSSGFPVAGSFSRTAVNHQAGARTQLAAVVSATMIVLTLLFLTPLLYHLPNAALAAVIVVAVLRLVDVEEAKKTFRVRRVDGYAMALAFALTLLLGVEEGVLLGALFALLAFVRRTAYPDITELGYVEEGDAFLGLRSHPRARTFPGVLVLRFDSPLYYANVPYLEAWLAKAVADRPGLRYVVVDCRGVDTVDATAVEALEDLISGYRSMGVEVFLAQVKLPVREALARAGLGEHSVYPTVRGALVSAGLLRRTPSEWPRYGEPGAKPEGIKT
jgi:SulP family sulfate permease